MTLENGRWIPSGAVLCEESGLGAVYTEDANGKFLAIAYKGKATKRDFYISFRSNAQRAEHIKFSGTSTLQNEACQRT